VEEDMPKVPSFQTGLPREKKIASSYIKKQRVSSNADLKDGKQRPIDPSTMVPNISFEPEAVPSKPYIGKVISDADF